MRYMYMNMQFLADLPLGERTHDLGVVTDECGADTVHLNVVTNKLHKFTTDDLTK